MDLLSLIGVFNVDVNVMMSMSQYQCQELKTVSVAVLSKNKQIRIHNGWDLQAIVKPWPANT